MEIYVYTGDDREFVGIVGLYSNFRAVWRYDKPGEFQLRMPVTNSARLLYRLFSGNQNPGGGREGDSLRSRKGDFGPPFGTPRAKLRGVSEGGCQSPFRERQRPEGANATWVWPQGATELFLVESVEIREDEGIEELEARGRTVSALLDRRSLTATEFYTGTHGGILARMVADVFAREERRFPGLDAVIDEGLGEQVTGGYEPPPVQLLEAVEDVCKAGGLGFRVTFEPVGHGLTLEAYQGVDRSEAGEGMLVVFDPEYGNLAKLEFSDSVEDLANYAYVVGEVDKETEKAKTAEYDAVAAETQAVAAGYGRYEAIIKYTRGSKTEDGEEMNALAYQMAMIDYGKAELAKKVRAVELTGEIEARSALFRLGIDYALGDVVRLRVRRWAADQVGRIREIEENWDDGIHTVRISIGDALPTISDRFKETRKEARAAGAFVM